MIARRLARFAAAASLALAVAASDDSLGAAQEDPAECPAVSSGPGPTVTYTGPNPDMDAPAQSPAEAAITGTAQQQQGRVDCVTFTLTRAEAGQEEPQQVARAVYQISAEAPQPWPFDWRPDLPYNDVYTVTAVGVGTFQTFQGPRQFTGQTYTRQFRTEIPPAPPTGLKITVDQQKRKAFLTWSRNEEADIVRYLVERAPSEGAFAEVGSPTSPAHTDDLAAVPPGTYRYRVSAVRRRSQNPEDTEGIVSPAPAEGTATVRGAPTATTTSVPPTTAPRSATTARRPTARNRPANRVDLRRFDQTTSTLPDGSGEPEEGAFGDLDFGERQDGRTDMTITELGEPVTGDSDDPPNSLLFIAAGLLAFVVLMHLRWIKKEVDRIPLEEVPPEA